MLNNIFLSLALVATAAGVCYDGNKHCHYWAGQNECKTNPEYMSEHCPISCSTCIVNNNIDVPDTQNSAPIASPKKSLSKSLTAIPVEQQNLQALLQQYSGIPFWGSQSPIYASPSANMGLFTNNPWFSQYYNSYGSGWLPYLKKA